MIRNILNIILLFATVIFAQEKKNNVFIYSNEPNSSIYINDQIFGLDSVSTFLQPGSYIITLKKDIYEWNSDIISDTILVIDNTVLRESYSFKNKIYLETSPEDAYIKIGDKKIGHSPLFLNPEIKQINLSKPGFQSKIYDIKTGVPEQNVELKFVGTEQKQLFRNTPWFKVLLGTALVLGGTAAYYKIEADNNYDRYLETNDQQYLDKTDSYDTISGLAFGVLQINFGFILYYLLSD